MLIALSPGVTYCEVENAFVFLDIRQDRYIQLSQRLTDTLVATREGRPAKGDIDALISTGLFVSGNLPAGLAATRVIKPRVSALEQNYANATFLRSVAMAWAHTVAIQQLKTRPLHRTLDRYAKLRTRRRSHVPRSPEISTIELARAFQLSNLLVPRHDRCLLKSLALVEFLSLYRRYPAIVFGICLRPFSAHCWVQDKDILLSDHIDEISHYTPILRLG